MEIGFLTYMSRSGSTLLSRLIHEEISGVCVLPEFRLPAHILSEGNRILQATTTDLGKLIELDYRFPALGLTEQIQTELVNEMVGKPPNEMIRLVVEAAMKVRGDNSEFVFVKLDVYGNMIPRIRSVFPSMKLLHIVRDARAVVNSMLSSELPFEQGQNMARSNPLFAAIGWRNFMCNIEIASAEMGSSLKEVRYEELVRTPSVVLDDLSDWLGCRKGNSTKPSKTYIVNDSDKNLHRNVQSEPIEERIVSWRKELTQTQGLLVEWSASKEMKSRGYDEFFFKNGLTLSHKRALLFGIIVCFARRVLYLCDRVVRYLWRLRNQPEALINRFRRWESSREEFS